jgi:hypothetical protein
VFVRDAQDLLVDRVIMPEIAQTDKRFTLVEGELTADTIKSIKDKKDA